MLARLRHYRFFSLPDLNRAIAGLLDDLNHRPFKKLPGTRHSQYLALDQPALMPLPDAPYQFAAWLLVRVSMDYHIEFEGHYYSVPHQLVMRQLDVRISGSTIECFYQNRRVASHIRSNRHGHTTLTEHMPPHHRAQSELSPERFLAWGLTIGPHTHDFVHRLIESWPHPEMAHRSCLGLLSLVRCHSPERLEAACQRAIAIGSIRQASVRSMLELGIESQPWPEAESDAAESLPVHENVRGAGYYQ